MDANKTVEKRFIFSGGGTAFAAHLRRPADVVIPSVAPCYLPVTGGRSGATADQFDHQGLIKFASASTTASGDYVDTKAAAEFTHGNFAQNDLRTLTATESTLSGLEISIPQDDKPSSHRVFAVAHLQAKLEAHSDRHTSPAFPVITAAINDVSVDGFKLKVVTVPQIFSQNETFEKLAASFEHNAEFRKQYGGLFFPLGEHKSLLGGMISGHQIPSADGLVYATVVSSMQWEGKPAPNTEIGGNRLTVDGIGTFYFGELLIDRASRVLTLLRFNLGSPCGGEGTAVQIQSRVGTMPPT